MENDKVYLYYENQARKHGTVTALHSDVERSSGTVPLNLLREGNLYSSIEFYSVDVVLGFYLI